MECDRELAQVAGPRVSPVSAALKSAARVMSASVSIRALPARRAAGATEGGLTRIRTGPRGGVNVTPRTAAGSVQIRVRAHALSVGGVPWSRRTNSHPWGTMK